MSNSVSDQSDLQTRGRLKGAALLRQALGFCDCEPAVIDALVSAGHVRVLGKGENLVHSGKPFDTLCVVLEGSIESSVLHQDGRRQLLAYLQTGDVGGLISLADHLGHATDLDAREASTTVLLIPGSEFRCLRDLHSSLWAALELQLAYRSRLLYERLAGDPSLPVDVRLARLLHIQWSLSGRNPPEGTTPTMRISQSDLGDFLGVGRQRANFAVQQLKKDHLIDQHYAVITIIDPQGLAKRAGL